MADTVPSPDLPKIKKHNAGDMKDMISNMPDVILHYILSLLTTKVEILVDSIICLYESNLENEDSANCLLDLVALKYLKLLLMLTNLLL